MKAQLFRLDRETIDSVPEASGVLQLLNDQQAVIFIAGVSNMRQALVDQLRGNQAATFFQTEETYMYTMRESELLRIFLRRHGHLPEGNALPDDLFD